MNPLLFLNIGIPELIAVLAYPVLLVYCIVDIVQSNYKNPTEKLIWILVVLFAPCLGSLIYLAVGRKG